MKDSLENMKLEEMVVDHKLAVELRLLGVKQKSIYAWIQSTKATKPLLRKMPLTKPINTSAAFTLTEMKDILTRCGTLNVRSDQLSNIVEWQAMEGGPVYETRDGYEVDAVAKMILELLKINIKL